MELKPLVPGLFPRLRYPHPFSLPCRCLLGKPAALEDIPLMIGGRTPFRCRRWEFLPQAASIPGKVRDWRCVAAATSSFQVSYAPSVRLVKPSEVGNTALELLPVAATPMTCMKYVEF